MKSVLGGIAASKYVIWHGSYSGTSPKPLQVWSSRDLSTLVRPRPVGLKSDLVKRGKKRTSDGQMKSTFTGIHTKLKSSQAYCKPFGKAVATLARTFVDE